MAYEAGYSFIEGRSNVKIEIDTSTGGATPVWEELCGLADVSVDPQLKSDTFSTLCDGADSTTVITGRDIQISGTAKYNTDNTQLNSLVGSVFSVGSSAERKMRITIYPYDAVLTGTWVFVAGAMTINTDEVISIPFDLKTVGGQEVTKPV